MLENGEILAVECIFGELLQGVKEKSEKEILLKFWTHLPKEHKEHYENVIIEAGEYSAKNKLFVRLLLKLHQHHLIMYQCLSSQNHLNMKKNK